MGTPAATPQAVLSVPGAWHLFQVGSELEKRGLLEKFYTSFPAFRASGRGVSKGKLKCLPLGELFVQAAKRLPGGLRGAAGSRLWRLKQEIFDAQVASSLCAFAKPVVYHGLSSTQRRSLARARLLGMPALLERASSHIRYQNRLLREEYRKAGLRERDFQPAWLQDAEMREYEIADRILLPSSFAKRSFLQEGVPAEKLEVIPYGTNSFVSEPPHRDFSAGRPLRVLYVGQVGLRKGIHYLLEALSALKDGRTAVDARLVGELQPEFRDFVRKTRWPAEFTGAVPPSQLASHYGWADVFVFPSLEDGFGLVLLEAMNLGLPVIVTDHTAGPDLVREGAEGYVVPVGDAAALKERILRFADDRGACRRMGEAARRKAAAYTWEGYVDRLVELYRNLIDKKTR